MVSSLVRVPSGLSFGEVMDSVVDNEHVIYLGRSVLKSAFRTYVYGFDGAKTLARTWIQYEGLLSTGLWFPRLEDVPEKVVPIETSLELESKETKSKSRKKDGD